MVAVKADTSLKADVQTLGTISYSVMEVYKRPLLTPSSRLAGLERGDGRERVLTSQRTPGDTGLRDDEG